MENNITAAAPAKAVYKRPSQAKEIWLPVPARAKAPWWD